MLALNLAKIRTPDEHVEREYQPESLEFAHEDFRVTTPVQLVFDIHKDKSAFHLVGRVRAVLELPCSRCLEPYALPVDGPFDLRYQPRTTDAGTKEREIDAVDMDTAYYENDEIDLGQLMQEQCYLALPMKPLCSEACRGLCALCGANLNLAACDCNVQWEDPRLTALKALKKES